MIEEQTNIREELQNKIDEVQQQRVHKAAGKL